MRKTLSILFCGVAVHGCGVSPAVARYPVHCYQDVLDDGSTINFQYIDYIDEVIGVLDYAFELKDSAYGTFTGSMAGNVISAKWSYTVEGAHQVEMILIRVDTDQDYRAHGELVAAENGVLSLKDLGELTWSDGMQRVRCDPHRFR